MDCNPKRLVQGGIFPSVNTILEEIVMAKVMGLVKLQIPAGKATPAPPVGPALTRHNILDCMNSTNAQQQMGLIIP